jgi:hypothetical protein
MWCRLNYENAYEGIAKVNLNQAKRYETRLCKIVGNINNIIETIVAVDLSNTNEGGEFLELESPATGVINSVNVARNLRAIELMNSIASLGMFLESTLSATKLGSYKATAVDSHIQVLTLVQKLIPDISVWATEGESAMTVDEISSISPLAAGTYSIHIGAHTIALSLFAIATNPTTFFADNTYNTSVTLPLLMIFRPVLASVDMALAQAKTLAA